MSPMFSIIIPVYNVAPYLRGCLDSLLAQTCGDWEAICVDDGSTDESSEILSEYSCKDRRFKVITQKNNGHSSSRNTAISISTGAYIGFLDADDKIGMEWLAQVRESIKENDADLYRLSLRYWFPEEQQARQFQCLGQNQFRFITDKEDIMRWGWGTWLGRAWSCVCFLRRDLLVDSGVIFPAGVDASEDTVFVARMLPFIKSVVQLPYDNYYYRQRTGSIWHRPRRGVSSIRLFQCLGRVYQSQISFALHDEIRRVAVNRIMRIVWWELHAWLLTHQREEEPLKGNVLKTADDLLAQVLEPLKDCRTAKTTRFVGQFLRLVMGNYALHLLLLWAMTARRFIKNRLAGR